MPVSVISGISGQDGSLLAALLLKKGYSVIGLLPALRESDLYRLEYLGIADQVQLRQVDLLDPAALEALLEDVTPDEFYNLAAISSVGLSFQIPMLTFEFNTRSVMNILESIRKVSPNTKFYQASSSEMFGNVGRERLPIRESFLFHPVSPYGISKASAHWLTVNYREAYKLRACCGILFNHESALRPPNFVIKKILRSVVRIASGSDEKLTLGNLNVTRDWGYAPDYVEAMWLMLQQDQMDDYLICSGRPMNLQDLVEKFFSHVGLEARDHIVTDPTLMRSLDLQIIYGDNTKAKMQLGWNYDLEPDQLIGRLIEDERQLMEWEAARA